MDAPFSEEIDKLRQLCNQLSAAHARELANLKRELCTGSKANETIDESIVNGERAIEETPEKSSPSNQKAIVITPSLATGKSTSELHKAIEIHPRIVTDKSIGSAMESLASLVSDPCKSPKSVSSRSSWPPREQRCQIEKNGECAKNGGSSSSSSFGGSDCAQEADQKSIEAIEENGNKEDNVLDGDYSNGVGKQQGGSGTDSPGKIVTQLMNASTMEATNSQASMVSGKSGDEKPKRLNLQRIRPLMDNNAYDSEQPTNYEALANVDCNEGRRISSSATTPTRGLGAVVRAVMLKHQEEKKSAPFDKKESINTRSSISHGDGLFPRNESDLASKVAEAARVFEKKIGEEQVIDVFKLREHWVLDDEQIMRIKSKRFRVACESREEGIGFKSDVQTVNMGIVGVGLSLLQGHHQGHAEHRGEIKVRAIHPHGKVRLAWDLMSVVIWTYDLIFLPMLVFELPDHPVFVFFDWFGASYWSIDIAFAFMTGVYIGGKLERRLSAVGRNYLRTWFVFDLTLILTDWISLIATSVSGGGTSLRARLVRIFRAGRFLRLLRLIKAKRIFSDLKARISNLETQLTISISKLVVIGLVMAHASACLWYLCGNSSRNGWVYVEGLDGDNLANRYLVSFQFSLARLHPSNSQASMRLKTSGEKVLAIVCLVIALVFSSVFISIITTTMGEMKRMRARRTHQNMIVSEYVRQHRISGALAMQVRKWVEKESKQKFNGQLDNELMQMLPVELMTYLRVEAWSAMLTRNFFFNMVHTNHPRTECRLCFQALSEDHLFEGSRVFATGDACTRMLFSVQGKSDYVLGKDKDSSMKLQRAQSAENPLVKRDSLKVEESTVGPGMWLCEAVLYTPWEHCGDLVCTSDVTMIALAADEVAAVAKEYEQALVDIVIYAQCFIEELNKFEGTLSDLPHLMGGESGDWHLPEAIMGSGSMGSLNGSRRHSSGSLRSSFSRVVPSGWNTTM